MRQYLARWLIALGIVTPLMFMLVPLVHRTLYTVEGPHANDSLWRNFQNMLGFYGGYVLLAATAGSLAHTWLVRRSPSASQGLQILWAVCVGVLVLLPQAALFGRGYWLLNIVAGAGAGLLYGVLVTLIPLFDRSRAELAQ